MDEQGFDTASVLLIFLMVSIMSIFGISLLIIMIRKSIQIRKLKRRGFIIVIFSYIISKLVICALLIIQILKGIPNSFQDLSPSQVQHLFKNSLFAAQISLTQLFLVAFETYIQKYVGLVPKLKNTPKKIRNVFYLIKGLYLIAAISLLLVFNIIQSVTYQVINIFALSINLILILVFLVSFFYLNFLMTGILLSEITRERINRLYKFVLLVLFSMFIVTGFDFVVEIMLQNGNFIGFIQLIQEKRDQYIIQCLIFIGFLVYTLLTQGLPIMYSLRRSTFNLFTVLKDQDQSSIYNFQTNSSLNENLIGQSTHHDTFEQIEQLQDFASLEHLEDIKSQIWMYYRGQHKSKLYLIRKSKRNLSNYLIEDTMKQLYTLNMKGIRQLNPIGYFTEKQILYLYQPFRFIHLVDYCLKCTKQEQKIQALILFAQSIKKLHDSGYVHGSLSPTNIFLLGKNQQIGSRIKFSGYGTQSLKRYFSFTTDYTNKNIYTAPQYLKQRSPVILKAKKPADIYSIGMIIYEVMTNNISYRNLDLKQLQQKIGHEDFRPKIQQSLKDDIKNMIRLCWSTQVEERPSIQDVIKNLKKLS